MAEITTGASMAAAPEGVKPLDGPWRLLQIAITAWLVVSLLWGLSTLSALDFFERVQDGLVSGPAATAEGETADFRLTVTALLFVPVFLLCIVAYARFFQRAMANLHALNAPHLTVSPRMMWLWYFVPFLCLWKPLEGVMEVWRESRDRAGLDDRVPPSVGAWWALWILGGLVAVFSSIHYNSAISLEGDILDTGALMLSMRADLASAVVQMATAALLYLMSSRIRQAQSRFIPG